MFGSLRCLICSLSIGLPLAAAPLMAAEPAPPVPSPMPFKDPAFPQLDFPAVGEWWKIEELPPRQAWMKPLVTQVPRDQSISFALYTHDKGVLKLTAQLVPLLPDEPREVVLEVAEADGVWREIGREPVLYPGWSAHFRVADWDPSKSVRYRVRHGEQSAFEGLIRRDPIEKDEIVVAMLSCNSSNDRGAREGIVSKLKAQDPDLLFFAGDQSYDHAHHTAAWLLFGRQFRDIMRDRPVITIPDDHDVGQANIWGAGGAKADDQAGSGGGYFFPAEYVNMVQRCQTWHLPDPVDPAPVGQGIGVYFTNLRVGGIDFAIIEDRKFKTGPRGTIPAMGPRPDHITDPGYDRKAVDLPELELLGDRQLRFLDAWTADWTGAEMKAVLSQTAFCGAVHLHGNPGNRLLADLDSNGWPQSGRNRALEAIRRGRAIHAAGDQHLAVLVRHGIDSHRDGPFGFTVPAIHNSYYGRWWWPEDGKAGARPVADSPLPWTGDYEDGFGNRITMLAYANPATEKVPLARVAPGERGDGYGLVRFRKSSGQIVFECWPKLADLTQGDAAQFPGWPVTISMEDNDGRVPVGFIEVPAELGIENPVLQLIDESDNGGVVYTQRFRGDVRRLPVYTDAPHTLRAGTDTPERVVAEGLRPTP